MEELTPLTPEELQIALNDFIDHFDTDNFSETALLSLKKTFQTHNITIQDWNAVIEFLEQNVRDVEAIRVLLLELSKYVVKDSDTYVTVLPDGDPIPVLTKDGRLIQGKVFIKPITTHENVEGLQKEITDKLPIVSEQQPQSGFVQNQVWLDINPGEGNNESEVLEPNYPGYINPIHDGVLQETPQENLIEDLVFDNEENNDNIILIEGEN